jgi:hypothetical protein
MCLCAAGFTGPGCTACGASSYCPINTQKTIHNYAVALTLTGNGTAAACTPLKAIIYSAVASSDAAAKMHCVFLPSSTPRTYPMVVVMVQTTSSIADSFSSLTFTGDVTGPPIIAAGTVSDNVALPCSTDGSRIPMDNHVACQCAAGWRTTSNGACVACEPNTFKAAPGLCQKCANGGCIACPSGTTSGVAASACSTPDNRIVTNGTSSSGSSSSVNIPAIAGGVVGGVVLLAIILFAVNQFYVVPAATAAAEA